ncbi:Leucine Rich repeats (2 copies) [Polystyrenella longa]|uniref:Leucine Rich repeats (2 copies) n=1 Tax=Polystyrenella longa TaxID=2528007 RepID=A0A518CRX1_9PLAN|nr:leucine-rich repeat domain-containing protein [Polystyrenella longa]QDU81972.1 Leucine Rich repeats (2 copies) [Polystyrenella longa]
MTDAEIENEIELTRYQRWRYSSLFLPSLLLILLVGVFAASMGRELYRRHSLNSYVSQLGGTIHRATPTEQYTLLNYSSAGSKVYSKRYYVVKLPQVEISDSQLQELAERMQVLNAIYRLDLSDATVTDVDFSCLSEPLELMSLQLVGTNLTETQLEQISQLQELIELDLSRNELSLVGIQFLARLEELTTLRLDHVSLTDEMVEELGRIPAIRFLSITNSGVTEETVKALVKSHPQIEITDD